MGLRLVVHVVMFARIVVVSSWGILLFLGSILAVVLGIVGICFLGQYRFDMVGRLFGQIHMFVLLLVLVVRRRHIVVFGMLVLLPECMRLRIVGMLRL